MNRMSGPVGLVSAMFMALAVWGEKAQAAGTQPGLLSVRYERSGGFAGTHDVVEIGTDGVVVAQGRLIGKGKGQLTAEQMGKLAALFEDWNSLQARYPVPAGSADGFEIRIRYGSVEVVASDMNRSLPETFKAVQAAIEKAARDAAGK
jgi:hypothetical protein